LSSCADDPTLEKYATPGMAVRGASIKNLLRKPSFANIFTFPRDETERKDGTSVAAPIAAGIAALFIEYTRSQKENECKDAKSRENMLKLFSAMSKPYPSLDQTYYVLDPWILLHSEEKRSEIKSILDKGDITFHTCN
jgi:hypothetical protein